MGYEYKELSLKRLGDPPHHLSKKQKSFHYVLEVSLFGLFSSYKQLEHHLLQLSVHNTDADPFTWAAVFGFVDHCSRLDKVLFDFPGLLLKREHLSELSDLIKSVKRFRNHLQHPEKLAVPDYTSLPLGTLSWRYHPLDGSSGPCWRFAGSLHSAKVSPKMPFQLDGHVIAPIGSINYGLGDEMALRISEIYLRIFDVPEKYFAAIGTIRSDEDPREKRQSW